MVQAYTTMIIVLNEGEKEWKLNEEPQSLRIASHRFFVILKIRMNSNDLSKSL